MANVYVGLSGGVDSAVSAALLKEAGHCVTGVFIKIWSPEFLECTWKEDRLDAMRVAVSLGVPFKELDLSEEYRKGVVDEMVQDYARGVTPNPDVLCNRRIKFGAFASWAFDNGADMIATGHYAQIRHEGVTYELARGKDIGKDQSYFLYRLTQDDLRRTLFPVGMFEKKDVRELAERFGLPVAKRPDSQGLCFVGDVSIKDFLSRYIELRSGPVIDLAGKLIGEHHGAALYTIGQRHGFRTGEGGPYYVTAIESKTNTLRVSTSDSDAKRKVISISDTHWISGRATDSCEAVVRYRGKAAPVQISENGVSVEFASSQIASPGQSIVFYDGEVCLGGATIDR